VSGILTSAGETRADAPVEMMLHDFLDAVVAGWQRTRGLAALDYVRDGVPDLPIISDTALRQMIDNVLDNALEAAPGTPLRITASCVDGTLTLRVRDRGPGFPRDVLERFGTPYQTSKGKPGRGLGLFLAVNVARTLGGAIAAHNDPDGGAEVVITLPLAALTPEGHANDGP
jgi:two-component system, sensor histidine kinase RegB